MITSVKQSRSSLSALVMATTSLAGLVYFYWYQDGVYVGCTSSSTGTGSKTFFMPASGQLVVSVLDSADSPDVFDFLANAPAQYPAWRTLVFVRSIGASPAPSTYRVEQQKSGGAWSAIATVRHDARVWQYSVSTPLLEDLATYAWRVIPVDAAGNDGTSITIASEKIVRRPDAPRFTATFVPATTKVTIAAA